jgi:hypothetical protein
MGAVRRLMMAGALVAGVVASGVPAGADPNSVNPIPLLDGWTGLPHLPGPTQAVFQVTGMSSPNHTERQNVLGTDLGIMWDDGRGHLLTAYGDTAGLGVPNLLAGSFWAWTSNNIYYSDTRDPSRGIFYNGFAGNLIPSPKIPGIEISRIPTAGISVGGVQFMSMMSVRDWGSDGHWDTNFASLAASGDDGRSWLELPDTRRANADPGYRNFQQQAFLKADGYVYRYGTPAGRNNPGFVSRVREADIANFDAYEFFDGRRWTKDPTAAAPILGGVGELSVMWNDYLHQYVMLTTDPFNSVVTMTAPNPEGPWSPPRVLIDVRQLPTQYAPEIFPYQTGRSLYFLLTVHSQYNVVLMRTPL